MTESSEPTPSDEMAAGAATAAADEIDLDAIEGDLDAIQTALGRLADGTYWTDEVTGEPISADVLATDPLTRRA